MHATVGMCCLQRIHECVHKPVVSVDRATVDLHIAASGLQLNSNRMRKNKILLELFLYSSLTLLRCAHTVSPHNAGYLSRMHVWAACAWILENDFLRIRP
jgi:hypothetical protein